MPKFGRNYLLEIDTDSGTLTVQPPFTIEFDVTRNTLTSANVAQVRIYNLSLKKRNLIRHNALDFGNYRGIKLSAGYGKNLAQIFSGSISQAWSVREGTNYITQIESFDGGFALTTGRTNQTYPAGTPTAGVIAALASSLPEVSVGTIGAYPGVLTRGAAYSGNTMDILRELTGGGVFIDNGKVNCLGTNEYILDLTPAVIITPESGLLGTPLLEQSIVRFDMLFEPRLNVGHIATLQSVTESNLNGDYKITAVKHRGIISESVAGRAVTTGEFFYDQLLVGR